MESLFEEFKQFSAGLKSTSVTEEAELFLEEVVQLYINSGSKINKKALFACAIFIAVQDTFSKDSNDGESDSKPEITVSDLLNSAEINIVDFFNVTCFLKKNYQLSEKVKVNLIALERKYLIVSALYDKFESMVTEIFCSSDSIQTTQNDKDIKANTILKKHKVLCWMLFLVAKAKVLWHRQELLATFHLLLCCIGEIIKITPTFLLLSPFDNITGKHENALTILEVLSNHFKTNFEEVREVYNGWLHVTSELKSDNRLPEIEDLQQIYTKLYTHNGDIDESLFLTRDWHLLPTVSENISSPRKYQSVTVRRTLDTAEALNTILSSTPDDLTQSLKLCLQKCTIDASSFIEEFLNESKVIFITEFVKDHESNDESLAERRFRLAARFYYIMLDALLRKESERLSPPGFTSFIQNKVFHKSLLACCLEVTLVSCGSIRSIIFTPVHYGGNYQAQGISFPWILKVFDLEAFMFFKIIESFIRGAPTITLQIINHLKLIEDKILDSLSWQSNSSVFTALSGNGCSPSCKAKYQSPEQSPSLWSPSKDISQQSPSTPHTCHAISIFLKKVCLLAYQRLEKLCSLLEIDKDTLANIWSAIEHVLYKKTHLLKDRHLDQIIMCCIFAVAKVSEKHVLFKSIINCYDKLPHATVSVYKQVLTSGKREFIVYFFNKEFNDEMGAYIISEYGIKKGTKITNISSSPVVLSPLYSLPSNKNIFISTLPQQSPFKNPNEIIFRKPYTVGSLTQPAKMLQDINISLNLSSANKHSNETKGKKRLQFDSDGSYSDKKSPTLSSAKKFLKFN